MLLFFLTTGRDYTSLLILAYCVDPYLWTASPSSRFSCIGYVFPITHLVLSYSMTFYAYASHSISSQLLVP